MGTVRLEPGTTKNRHGRLIKFNELDELRQAIHDQWAIHEGLRQTGVICPPPKAGPAQAAVDSATEVYPESGWFLAYSSSLGRRVIGEIIPESCIHLCEEP